jgi:hypothetical protein
MVMTEYIWPLVAALGLVLAYSVLMRWLGNVPRADFNALLNNYHSLKQEFDLHTSAWNVIGREWRDKVRELEEKCDRVTVDAKNEIAGYVAQAHSQGEKGWR